MRSLCLLCVFSVAACAAPPASTTDLLRQVGQSVERFWSDIQAINCLETVDQLKLGQDGKVVFKQHSQFDYLAVLQLLPDDLLVDESRSRIETRTEDLPKEKKHKAGGTPAGAGRVALLLTNGFPTFQFIFHPFYQSSFEFSAPEMVQADGKRYQLVRFRHVRGARSPSVLRLKSREYPVEWQGSAWIDPETSAIVHVNAALAAPMAEVGLIALAADVRYSRVPFKDVPGVHWLPETATIEAATAHQRWRNVHSFANYRHFMVDVKTQMESPK